MQAAELVIKITLALQVSNFPPQNHVLTSFSEHTVGFEANEFCDYLELSYNAERAICNVSTGQQNEY